MQTSFNFFHFDLYNSVSRIFVWGYNHRTFIVVGGGGRGNERVPIDPKKIQNYCCPKRQKHTENVSQTLLDAFTVVVNPKCHFLDEITMIRIWFIDVVVSFTVSLCKEKKMGCIQSSQWRVPWYMRRKCLSRERIHVYQKYSTFLL